MKCALVVGHDRSRQGAENSYSGMSEYSFNSMLAIAIQRIVTTVDVEIIYRDVGLLNYKKLIKKINKAAPDFIISLHCNSCKDPSIQGSEVLYWNSSFNGKKIATFLQRKINSVMRNRDRGIKPIYRESQRGGKLLKRTNAPCVIAEPFFIANIEELQFALSNYVDLVWAFGDAIEEVINII